MVETWKEGARDEQWAIRGLSRNASSTSSWWLQLPLVFWSYCDSSTGPWVCDEAEISLRLLCSTGTEFPGFSQSMFLCSTHKWMETAKNLCEPDHNHTASHCSNSHIREDKVCPFVQNCGLGFVCRALPSRFLSWYSSEQNVPRNRQTKLSLAGRLSQGQANSSFSDP